MTPSDLSRSATARRTIQRLVVGISGASGSIYGIRLLEVLREVPGLETHLVISRAAKRTLVDETEYTVRDVEALATRVYDDREMTLLVDSALDFWLTSGPYADRFERRMRQFFGCRDFLLVNSGSSANPGRRNRCTS